MVFLKLCRQATVTCGADPTSDIHSHASGVRCDLLTTTCELFFAYEVEYASEPARIIIPIAATALMR